MPCNSILFPLFIVNLIHKVSDLCYDFNLRKIHLNSDICVHLNERVVCICIKCNYLLFIFFVLFYTTEMTMHRYKLLYVLWFCHLAIISCGGSLSWQPCPELSSALRYPCRCKVEPFGPKSQLGAVSMDCDYVVFHTESPILPNGAPIVSFSQRHCGQQVLPTQVLLAIKLPHVFLSVTIFCI